MTQLVIPSEPIVVNPPQGMSQLPMVEIDRSNVLSKRKHIRFRRGSSNRQSAECSFGNFDAENLEFSAWEFFHAAKKTELASSFTGVQAIRNTYAFAFEHQDTFIWNTNNFRKIDNSNFELEDFASAALAGRVGEAIAYLTMIKWGYVFWDRCQTVWGRAAVNANIIHPESLRSTQFLPSRVAPGRPQNEPDFIFEKGDGSVALMEAKGSFVNPIEDKPSTKEDLRQALKQLAAWSTVITPTPEKSYGIGTYLREENDSGSDPSLIAYVDPPGQDDPNAGAIELPPDLIRRLNYAAWLAGMGLVSASQALGGMKERAAHYVDLPILEVGGRSFAFVNAGWSVPEKHLPKPESWMRWAYALHFWDLGLHPSQPDWRIWRHIQHSLDWVPLIIGIERTVLKLIESALRYPTRPVLKEFSGFELGRTQSGEGSNKWSLMPDGTFIGLLDSRTFEEGFKGMETFQL
ncbi:MAG: hypothetical protein ACP5SH_23210 [Syntrophobacteraceae bacterium]